MSQNMTKTSEGYLLCKNVKVAHTKPMEYPVSLFKEGAAGSMMIRNSDIILTQAFMDSMVGKPLLVNHPACQTVSANDYKKYIRGCITKAYTDGENLIADVLVYDKDTIELIENGIREVSASMKGYLTKETDSVYIKNPTEFNHLAVVEFGRAGREYRFIDSMEDTTMDESQDKVSLPVSFFDRLLGRKSDDKEPSTPAFNDALESFKADVLARVNEIASEVKELKEAMAKEPENTNTTYNDAAEVTAAVNMFVNGVPASMCGDAGVRVALGVASQRKELAVMASTLIGDKDIATMDFNDAEKALLILAKQQELCNKVTAPLTTNTTSTFRVPTPTELNNGGKQDGK